VVAVRVVGIDTDSKGSVAVLDTELLSLDVYAIPNLVTETYDGAKRRSIDYPVLAAIMIDVTCHADVAFLEKQWSRPLQGVASTFGFGTSFGVCLAATAAGFLANQYDVRETRTKIKLVTAADWKHDLKLDGDKDKALALATKLFPLCAKAWAKKSLHTSAAEASLLAFYGASVSGVRMKPGSIIRPQNKMPYTVHVRSLLDG